MITAPELVGSIGIPKAEDRRMKHCFLSITDRVGTTLTIVSFDSLACPFNRAVPMFWPSVSSVKIG
jgi:hypothetical protein